MIQLCQSKSHWVGVGTRDDPVAWWEAIGKPLLCLLNLASVGAFLDGGNAGERVEQG